MTRTTALLAVATHCALIAGVNLPNALGPLYAARFGLDALDQAVLFSSYVLTLVAALVLAASPAGAPLRRLPPTVVLGAGVAVAVVGDVLLALGVLGPGWLLAGRVLGGVAVGLATGATASAALLGLGERGRTSVAFGAVGGSLLGTLAGGALGSWTRAAETTAHLAHAALLVMLLAWLLLSRTTARAGRRSRRAPAFRTETTCVVVGGYRARHRRAGLLLGAMAWSAAGVVLALLPVGVRTIDPDASTLVAVLPTAAFLAAAWAAQAGVGRHLLQARAWQVALPLAVGTALVVLALEQRSLVLVLLAAAVCGTGQGPAYGLGLATITHGVAPQDQGRTTARYAAVAYAACGVTTLVVGALAATAGVVDALGALAAALAAGGVAATVLAGRRQVVVLAPAGLPAGVPQPA